MRHHVPLFLAVLGTAAAQYEWIYSDNGMPWRGEYGQMDICPTAASGNASFTYALEFKYDDLDDVDYIGGNGVKLYCRDENDATTGYVTSKEGKNGDWQGIRACPKNEFFIGFRLRVFPEQGTWGDDFGVDNIQLECTDGTIVDGLATNGSTSAPSGKSKGEEDEEESEEEEEEKTGTVSRLNGNWGSWEYCPGDTYVLGIRTVVEEGHISDDAGLTDVTLYCG